MPNSGTQLTDLTPLAIGDLVFFDADSGDGTQIDHCLREQRQAQPDGDIRGLAARFQKQLAEVVAGPWQMATGEDRRWSTTVGADQLDPCVQLMQRYMDHVMMATLKHPNVTEAFYHVAQMVEPPTLLFRPDIVLQVFNEAMQ